MMPLTQNAAIFSTYFMSDTEKLELNMLLAHFLLYMYNYFLKGLNLSYS